jgi:NAD-reducing hydrogenase small subunit
MSKPKVATVWLEGCSGCHMSFLDLDERLVALNEKADIVYGPLADTKEYPEDVDVCLVEGAIGSEGDLHKIQVIRERTKLVVSLGDCAVNSNVPSMRNPFKTEKVLGRAYLENVDVNPVIPDKVIPKLLPQVVPVHQVVKVDVFIPGCPPSADTIFFAVSELLEGRLPDLSQITRFGA